MRLRFAGSLTALMTLLAASALAQPPAGKKGPGTPAMRLTSTSWADGAEIPGKYSMAGGATSPELSWTNVPMGTVTFALLFHDPDVALARGLGDVTHWIVWNIPGTVTKLDEGIKAGATLPDGTIQGKNIANQNAYFGPGAPANGPHHHYTFELFALDTKLDLGPDATRADVMKAIDGHILGKAVYAGRYHQ